MHISWLGETTVRLQTKPFDKDVVIIIDPYKPEVGGFPRSLTPDIGLYTRGQKGSVTLSGNPFILSAPGETETKGILISAVYGHDSKDIMFRIDSEQISIGHLGLAEQSLTDEQLEMLSGVDILLVPVGGGNTYDADKAIKAVNAVEPRIVIPMAFNCENNTKADKVDTFLKDIGAENVEPEKKIIVKKKDLPQDEMRVVLLSKE